MNTSPMQKRLLLSFALFTFGLAAQVRFVKQTEAVEITIDGQPFSTLYYKAAETKPYLHPLRSASGKIVTRTYPMGDVAGEARDHVHHRGLWFSHGDVNGWDFWANEPSQKGVGKGRGVIAFKKLLGTKDGKAGRLQAEFVWKDGENKELLTEDRMMVIAGDKETRTIDFDLTLTALAPVTFGDTKEGTFALRLARQLEEAKQSGTMKNAGGATKEKDVWGKRSPWVDYSGTLDGESLGIAIFDHPSNPRHPTYWHSRAYGLFAANMFGVRDFERDKTKDGKLEMKAGDKMRLRYRVLIHAGDTEKADIAKRFAEYAAKK